MITSPHNPRIKLIRALAGRSKERREAHAFLAEGIRLVEAALDAGWPFRFVLFSASCETSRRGKKTLERLAASNVEMEEVSPEILRSASETENSQGLVAVLELPPSTEMSGQAIQKTENALDHEPGLFRDFILIADQIRDPGNLGTLIRSAAGAGAQSVIIPPETTDPYAPKVVRAGMGAHFLVEICCLSWEEIREKTRGLTLFLAGAGGTTSCWQANFRQPVGLIIGGEADGASEAAQNMANLIVNIPMPGKIESLNAGAAGAIIMFEVVRQRSEAL